MPQLPRRPLALIVRLLLPLVILMAGVGLFVALTATAPTVKMAGDTRRVQQVRVFRAQLIEVQRQWHGYGTAEAEVSADIPAQVTATVEEIPDGIDPGTPVKKGQLLIQLDDSDFQRQVEIAEQTLAQLRAQLAQWEVEHARLRERLDLETRAVGIAGREFERVRELIGRGVGTQQDVDRSERELLNAERNHVQTAEAFELMAPRRLALEAQIAGQESTLQLARQDLARCRITSPIDGVLQEVDVEPGERVTMNQRVARVVSLGLIEVPLRLPAGARGSVHVGDAVKIEPTSRRGVSWDATVARIAPEDDPSTRTMTVFAMVDQHEELAAGERLGNLLTPGTFVAGRVTSEQKERRWVVPRRSVRGGRVLVVQDGVVRSEPVEVDYVIEGHPAEFGLPDDQWAVLDAETTGLTPGQLVMVNAAQAVLDGDRVDPVLPEMAPRSASRATGADVVQPGTRNPEHEAPEATP